MSEVKLLNIVLVSPEIPNNTGNIGRTCVGTRAKLHLIEPIAFEISDKHLKRAGLDYWPHLDWQIHKNWDEFMKTVKDESRLFFFTTKVKRRYFDIQYQPGDYLVFGRETKGLDEALLRRYEAQTVTIPQYGPIRSHNLSNAVAVAAYEAIRQFETNP